MECPEQFSLSYIDGLTSKSISEPLEFGSIMHYALEHQFDYKSPEECIYAITDSYRKWRSKTLLNSHEGDTLNLLLGLVEVTFPEYCRYWEKDDASIDWIQREVKFDVPYNLTTSEGIRTIRLRGMRDGMFRTKQKQLGVFETKNKSRINENEISDGLKVDMQTLFYCFTAFLQTGEMPTQVKYNVIRRSSTYRRKDEPAREYVKRVAIEIKKNPDKYFMRWVCTLSANDIKNFTEKTLDPLLRQFVLWWDSLKKNPIGQDRFQSPYHLQNLNALVGKYGTTDMWDKIVNNSTRRYQIRSVPFPELVDSFLVTPATSSRGSSSHASSAKASQPKTPIAKAIARAVRNTKSLAADKSKRAS